MKVKHGYVRRLALTSEQTAVLDDQGHAARALWNLLHDWTTGHGRCHRRSLKDADAVIRQARKDIPWLADLPAQAAVDRPDPRRRPRTRKAVRGAAGA